MGRKIAGMLSGDIRKLKSTKPVLILKKLYTIKTVRLQIKD
jgi:hypothetical protein